ncbi:hypothetical protein BDV96DRAFT_77160 [Lophiotrema nucula]|uniref:Uncharacterized protein n=1 Tax=Lophiotrema nucula TaxID=690887 RepID=A0A6A5Z7V5_9PLEO|nr:hypothetical protein BDV96DRAFT_77160 [Lophiotrema nucula]
MPAIPVARDSNAPQFDSLAPRDAAPESADLNARQPAAQAAPAVAVTLNAFGERSAIGRREIFDGIIPSYYNFDGPSPGTVVGIVLGSVAGFLLLCWLLYSLTMLSGSGGRAIAGEEEIVVRRRRGSDSRRSRRSTRTEVREFSRSPRRREQIIVEERRAPPRTRSVVVEERVRVPGDDVVEVIEEHDEYRTRRGGGRRSGGYSRY